MTDNTNNFVGTPNAQLGNITPPPAVQLTEAAANTIVNANPETILADLELIINLVRQFKAATAGVHPSVKQILTLLF